MNSDLQLLTLIWEDMHLSQRELARRMNLSLGTINNMIQTFETNKILTVHKESARNVVYSLTQKGQILHNQLYVEHISNCFDTVTIVRKTFKEKLTQLADNGKKIFYIQGQTDELIRLAKMCFFELSRKSNIEYSLLSDAPDFDTFVETLEPDKRKEYVVVGWENQKNNLVFSLDYVNLLS